MAISRARKEELVAEYTEQLEQSQGCVMAQHSALSVKQMEDLRHRVREKDALVFVVKNTLLTHVLNEKGLQPPAGLLTGPLMVAFCHQDVPPVAAVFRDFSKDVESGEFIVKAALLEGRFLSAAEALAIADLPSREVLLSHVLRTINAPASQVVGTVASGIRQVVNVLQAYVDKLEDGDSAAQAAA
ncbi:MAG: 50S ribosomal protein L10 [Anaerolineae bacterium]|nr:50S ribosomal protein L10 [Anaerolineae bacterium]